MEYIRDFLFTMKISMDKSLKAISKNWIIALLAIVYGLVGVFSSFIVLVLLRGPFSILSGLFLTMLMSSLISNYLYLLKIAVAGGKIDFKDFKEGFGYYMWKIYGVFFLLWLLTYILELMARLMSTNLMILGQLVSISFLVLLNALPETIYQTNYTPEDSLKYSLNFMKENWLHWALPNILILGIMYFLSRGSRELLLTGFKAMGLESVFKGLLTQLLLGFFMIFRGNLYSILDNSNMRNRRYKYDRD